jgi:hypothetical protein
VKTQPPPPRGDAVLHVVLPAVSTADTVHVCEPGPGVPHVVESSAMDDSLGGMSSAQGVPSRWRRYFESPQPTSDEACHSKTSPEPSVTVPSGGAERANSAGAVGSAVYARVVVARLFPAASVAVTVQV